MVHKVVFADGVNAWDASQISWMLERRLSLLSRVLFEFLISLAIRFMSVVDINLDNIQGRIQAVM